MTPLWRHALRVSFPRTPRKTLVLPSTFSRPLDWEVSRTVCVTISKTPPNSSWPAAKPTWSLIPIHPPPRLIPILIHRAVHRGRAVGRRRRHPVPVPVHQGRVHRVHPRTPTRIRGLHRQDHAANAVNAARAETREATQGVVQAQQRQRLKSPKTAQRNSTSLGRMRLPTVHACRVAVVHLQVRVPVRVEGETRGRKDVVWKGLVPHRVVGGAEVDGTTVIAREVETTVMRNAVHRRGHGHGRRRLHETTATTDGVDRVVAVPRMVAEIVMITMAEIVEIVEADVGLQALMRADRVDVWTRAGNIGGVAWE
eukprot:m.54453 g.54453  ORF g.54453 m.54453 type:complete len:311 (+) comp7528_c0_seq1:565-1497(+)